MGGIGGVWQSALRPGEASARVLWANTAANDGSAALEAPSISTAGWDKVDQSSDYLTQFGPPERGSTGIICPGASALTPVRQQEAIKHQIRSWRRRAAQLLSSRITISSNPPGRADLDLQGHRLPAFAAEVGGTEIRDYIV